MQSVTLNISEHQSLARQNRAVRIGIPFPRSRVYELSQLQLVNEQNKILPCQISITAKWDDQSIRWVLIDFFATIAANTNLEYELLISEPGAKNPPVASTTLDMQTSLTEIQVNSGDTVFNIDKKELKPFNKIVSDNKPSDIDSMLWILEDSEGVRHNALIESITLPEPNQNLRNNIILEGYFKKHKNISLLRFSSTLTFFAGSSLCDINFTLHNPQAAEHKGGFWDLGDPGSEFFKSLTLEINFSNSITTTWKNSPLAKSQTINGHTSRLYQNSSGGENWNHHIHIDKDGESTVDFKGYQLIVDNELIEHADRTSPTFSVTTEDDACLNAHIHQFWQNFPKAFSIHEKQLVIELFPQSTKAPFELQGGEQKTHAISLSFDKNCRSLDEHILPLNVTLPLSHYSDAQAIPSLPNAFIPGAIDKIIKEGIDGERNFFWKREKADEYGWRNFGELWADHETLEHGNDESLVSHYNNQYDVIYGFIRQYVLSGNDRWFELADKYSRHINDIDTYHTTYDRPEYNFGLFWHTDHYLDGRYCTHRTFSKEHLKIDHVEQSGGGPGSEHCYTHGLLLHYLMTGCHTSKDNLLNVIEWTKHVNEGDGTLLARLFEFVKRDLSNIKKISRGEYLFNHRFPLSRGTGNYINTLIDAYILKTDPLLLNKIAWVIQNSFSKSDDIIERKLIIDIEKNWHYTIFLQSVIRYLDLKESISQYGPDYHSILQAFLHYADYILKNEQPYLENEDRLVYPNTTWIAQDIRKVFILYVYAQYVEKEKSNSIMEKQRRFIEYIYKELSKDSKAGYTRIQAILLQSHIDFSSTRFLKQENNHKTGAIIQEESTQLTRVQVIKNFLLDILIRALKINLKNEIRWLKFRI